MYRILVLDHHAVLVKDQSGQSPVCLVRATGPVETAYLHIIATMLRKLSPQVSLCAVGTLRKVPTGYAFDCMGVWDNKEEARRHFDVMPIPPDAHGKMMACLDGSVIMAGTEQA